VIAMTIVPQARNTSPGLPGLDSDWRRHQHSNANVPNLLASWDLAAGLAP